MEKKIERNRSKTLPSSPTHSSSSSSDFEFRISISPRKSSAALCPADELFYKGKILPLHLSPRVSLVRKLLASSSTSSSDTTTTESRDSSSSNDSTSSSFASDLSLLAAGEPCFDSSRPSSATDDDLNPQLHAFKRLANNKSSSGIFFLSRFSNVFKKDNLPTKDNNNVKKMSLSAKEMIRKYMKKVKPLYEKLSSKQQQVVRATCVVPTRTSSGGTALSQTFSFNLKGAKMMRRSYVASCPSSMRTSPSHSGVLNRNGMPVRPGSSGASTSQGSSSSSETSTMEELQNAIQGAIAHCKNSMLQNSSSSFNNYSNSNSNIHNKVSQKYKAFEI